MEKLNVIFTMDCEAINEIASGGGPRDWDFCKRSIAGFSETLLKEGYRPTLFVVPFTAERHSRLLLELENEGVELALHYHPQDHGYSDYLGAFDYAGQKSMIKEGMDVWSHAIGSKPESFRGGNLSANDYTFPVLEELGFKQTSLSVAGRNFTRLKSNWHGASMWPYHTNRANRLLPGDMDILEVPLTSDWESIMWGGLTTLELRIEMVDARAHGFTIRKNVERLLKDKVSKPVIMFLTHNIFDYSDTKEFRSQVLHGIFDEINRCTETNDLSIDGPSLKEYHRLFDKNV